MLVKHFLLIHTWSWKHGKVMELSSSKVMKLSSKVMKLSSKVMELSPKVMETVRTERIHAILFLRLD